MFYSKFYCQECNLHTRIMCFTDETDLFINWRDSFTADGTDLCNISTGAEPPQEVTLDLLNAHSEGEKSYETCQRQTGCYKIFLFLFIYYLFVFTQDSLFSAYCDVINEGPAIEDLIIFKAPI